MCGVAGVIGVDADRSRRAVDAMCTQMFARGPDDGGVEAEGMAVVGSRRLAIIDPSPAGHQPMRDARRGTTIVFNGMIYNFRELRRELELGGVAFASDCDTEVVLRAYGAWGPACVEHLHGMFAFAIWDDRRQTLFLARDRLGIKPLYYTEAAEGLAFASQVKALLASGLVPARVDRAALRTYLSFGAVSEPVTAIAGVSALPAGHHATYRDGSLAVERYWAPPVTVDADIDEEEAVVELSQLLEASVRRHLVADAPLGIFLSGGLDSSLLTALAARETPHVRTVSVVFEHERLSEREHMQRVVDHVDCDHIWAPLAADDVVAWTSEAFTAMDQPTFDGINTYVVSRAAAGVGLKVALSGLGADELLDGYGHGRRVRLLERAPRLPRPVTAAAGRALALAGAQAPAAKAGAWLREGPEPGSSYALLRALFLPGELRTLVRGGNGDAPPPPPRLAADHGPRGVSRLDLENYMRNVLLRDTDAMSMANSLEVRVPYLDDAVVDRVLRLPAEIVVGRGKALLARAAAGLVPPENLARRKQGFVLPLGTWLQGRLRQEVEETLARPPEPLAELVDAAGVRAVWSDFLRDGRRWLRPWSLYALYRWAETL